MPAELVLDGAGRVHARGVTADAVACGARLDFHSIVPAALRSAWSPRGTGLGPWWPALAPALESVCTANEERRLDTPGLARCLAATAAALTPAGRQVPDHAVRALARQVLDGKVRGYDQAVTAVRAWLSPDRLAALAEGVRGRPWTPRRTDRLVLRVVKEGHMSSVVVVELRRPGGTGARFVLNTARDGTDATRGQALVALQLRAFQGRGAVRVLEQGTTEIGWFGRRLQLGMLATTWAPGQEVHPVPPGRPGRPPRLLLVDAFDDTPGHAVPGIRGRLLPEADADRARDTLTASLVAAARSDGDRVTCPVVQLSDGDVVIDLARHPGVPETAAAAVVNVVATEARPWTGPPAWWLYQAACLAARDDHGGTPGLLWQQARTVVATVLAGATGIDIPATTLLASAAAIGDRELDRVAAAIRPAGEADDLQGRTALLRTIREVLNQAAP